MTSQKAIQSLIAEIDGVLNQGNSRLPWFSRPDLTKQRRVLEKARSYLVSLQQIHLTESEKLSQKNAAKPELEPETLQAIAKDLYSLRSHLIQPLEADVEELRRQRESLVKEVRQLESRKHHYQSLAQQQAKQQQIITEFLQVMAGRLQESLTQQMAQTLTNLESQFLTAEAHLAEQPGIVRQLAGGSPTPLLHPQERLEQLRQMQVQSDRALQNLDSTMRVVFEALQRNLHSYQESLTQGLEKMHGLGQQGEAMFGALVAHLASQLGKEVSVYLQSPLQMESGETTAPTIPEILPDVPISKSSSADDRSQSFALDLDVDVDVDSMDSDDLNTIIQMDIEALNKWRAFKEKHGEQPQEPIISLFNQPPTQPPEAPQAEVAEVEDTKELDDFYQTLFGSESGGKSGDLKERSPAIALSPPLAAETSVDQALFSGTSDPALETVSPPPNGSSLPDRSWEDSLFEEEFSAAANYQLDTDYPEVPDSNAIISSLTDLLEPMNLRVEEPEQLLLLAVNDNAFLENPQQSTGDPNELEDGYIPAPPEESLLATDGSEEDENGAFVLDQRTFQQLSEDLSSFEQFKPAAQSPQTSVLVETNASSTPVEAREPELNGAHQELLAEDWEDMANSASFVAALALEPITKILTAEELQLDWEERLAMSVALDASFAFPSEQLRLELETAIGSEASAEEPEMGAEAKLFPAEPSNPESTSVSTLEPTTALPDHPPEELSPDALDKLAALVDIFSLEELNWNSVASTEASAGNASDRSDSTSSNDSGNDAVPIDPEELAAVLELFPPEDMSWQPEMVISGVDAPSTNLDRSPEETKIADAAELPESVPFSPPEDLSLDFLSPEITTTDAGSEPKSTSEI